MLPSGSSNSIGRRILAGEREMQANGVTGRGHAWRSTVLRSSLPARSRARTTKRTSRATGAPGVLNFVTPGLWSRSAVERPSPPEVVDM